MTIYDVCVVGAGPAGATCAHYAARAGLRVLILERRRFPRDKLCGNAVAPPAQKHLSRMGVMQALVPEKELVWVESGGFVSPGGVEALAHDIKNPGGRVAVVKRLVLDERVARAAVSAGAVLIENAQVSGAILDRRAGVWSVTTARETFRARTLVAADGAHSPLARSLGVVKTPPNAICSRAYVEAGTHDFPWDGVGYLTELLLPGCAGMMRNAEGDLTFCCYVMPQGRARPKDLESVHQRVLDSNPFVRRHLGSRYRMERMRGAWLRLGGVPRSAAERFLVIGDAAGHQDPITGDGIQLAMEGAMYAADTLAEAFACSDFSEKFLQRYHRRWMKKFGYGFLISRVGAEVLPRMPWLVDAIASAAVNSGKDFFHAMTDALAGGGLMRPFMQPHVALPVGREMARHAWRRPRPVH